MLNIKKSISYFLFFPLFLTAQNIAVRDFHIDLLKQEEQKIKAKFWAVAGITEKEWQDALRQAQIDYNAVEHEVRAKYSACEPVSEEIKNMTNRLLTEQNINPDHIEIFGHTREGTLSAYASIILISESFLKSLDATQLETEAVIMHEIMHIAQQEQIERQCIRTIIKDALLFNKMRLIPIRNRWQRFREKRADILAGLTSLERAKALATLYSKLLKSDLYNSQDKNHPSLRARIEYMLSLHKQMESGKPKAHNIIEKGLFNLKHFLYDAVDFLVPGSFVQ